MVSLFIAVQFLSSGKDKILRSSGLLMLLVAVIFIFTPFYILTKHGGSKTGESYMQTNQVVYQGLYALTRHPQYLGYCLMVIGFALIWQHWETFLLAFTCVICFYVQAVLEERYCRNKFGDPYAAYLQRVPRFNIFVGLWRVFHGYRDD